MLALRLVRLIESHSEMLARGLMTRIMVSAKCNDLHKVPEQELEERSREIYRNLSDWLLHKTESDIEHTYRRIGRRRAEQGVSFSQFYWAIIMTKEHLWDFLIQEGVTETPLDLQGSFELIRLTEQFFERAIYFVAEEYEEYARKEHGHHGHVLHTA